MHCSVSCVESKDMLVIQDQGVSAAYQQKDKHGQECSWAAFLAAKWGTAHTVHQASHLVSLGVSTCLKMTFFVAHMNVESQNSFL